MANLFSKKRVPSSKSGMTLIELVVVMGILGILFAAVYMFFVKGTEQFHFTRRQNQLATSGKLILEILSDEILWAGYMPGGGWTEEEWRPVELASTGSFHFYADYEDDQSLEDSDHRKIFLDAFGIVHVTDDDHMDRIAGTDVVDLQYNYLDAGGNFLAKPLDEVSREAVRHVIVKITLQDTYMGDVYQTVMQTMITPRNLGVYHNFDPLFYLPDVPDAKIVVNIDGDSLAHTPTLHQSALLTLLDSWGYTLVDLTDDELESYDYDSSGVDIVILRNMGMGFDHIGIAATLQGLRLPIIALDPEDAKNVFLMGDTPGANSFPACSMQVVVIGHHIHDDLPNPFIIYDTSLSPSSSILTLTDFTAGTELITGAEGVVNSGVCVIHEDTLEARRIHYCAPEFAYYHDNGKRYLWNVINWLLPEETTPPLGEEIESEGFEGDSPGEVAVSFWEDDLEGGEMLSDSIPLYTDFGEGSKSMLWVFSSTGLGEITRLLDTTLQMHRTSLGGSDRNIAISSVNLSSYSEFSDQLYIKVQTWKGGSEIIGSEDGVFLISTGGSVEELVSEDFETLALGNGDVEFWGDLYGRHRIHSPEPPWNNTTTFVTLDSRVNGSLSRSRMMIEIDTSTLDDDTPIVVSYRMTDHADETHNFSAADNGGDYVGWSLGNGIDDAVLGSQNLAPGSKPNGVWADYTYEFTPSGTMPSTIYVVFSQRGSRTASSATGTDGISFDDITIYADNTAIDLDRVGVPLPAAGWQNIAVDLDDAAVSNAVPFSADFGIALSQDGMGPWANHGMHWRYFELGYIGEKYSVTGWTHRPNVVGETDDWLLEDISGNHKWTLHANNPATYSNSTDCWLETPQFTIPASTVDAILSFQHSLDIEAGSDYCWIEITTNGGTSWNLLESTSYNGYYSGGGHDAFSGTFGTATVEIPLDLYVGSTVQLRFVFHSDISLVRSGWTLDNFEASGVVSGVIIETIGFKPENVLGTWVFNDVDVYLGSTTETSFSGDGEWDKSSLTYVGTYSVAPTGTEWVTIALTEDYLLPATANLIVKLEMEQTGTSPGYSWIAANQTDMSRWGTSFSADPFFLTVADVRPAFMIGTASHGEKYVDADSTQTTSVMPLAFSAQWGDFEGIYLISELGFGGETSWVSGGDANDWEIGTPVFTPDIDPALVFSNGNKIAGNDLTDDGLYMSNAWAWLRSGAFEMADASAYDTVTVAFDRCLRLALNDYAYVQMAFTDSVDPPLTEGEWIIVKECHYNDDSWQIEVIPLTYYFNEAIANGKTHYFIRFVLDSGVFAEFGGWNIDNVGFYGRFAE